MAEKKKMDCQLQGESKTALDDQLVQSNPQIEEENRHLKEQIDVLRAELVRAEGELDDRVCWSPPHELQHWLQLTYEVELRSHNKKRSQAEKQLEHAKDAVSQSLFYVFLSFINCFFANQSAKN